MTRRGRLWPATALAAVALSASAAPPVVPEDWPQWLGPARNGTVHAPGTFSGRRSIVLRVAWRKPMEAGTSGLAIAGDRVFTVAGDGEMDYAIALSAGDGHLLWRAPLDPSVAALERGPASTPAVHGGLVYVLSAACRLRALEAGTGKVAWIRDLKAHFAVELRQGCQSSPLVEGPDVLVQAGGRENERTLLAFEAATGAPRWTAGGALRTFYTSPVVADLAGTRQVVVHHTVPGPPPISGLFGVRLSDRAVLWQRTLERNMSFETPVVLPPDRVLLLTWNDAHAFRVAASGGSVQAEPAWHSPDLTADVSPPVVHDGHLYGFGGDFLVCLDARTGRLAWKEKLYRGSVILADGHLVVLSVNSGLLRVVEATPAAYREKASLEVLNRGSRAETPPSFAGRRIFIRNDEELVVVEVTAGAADQSALR